ncbi:uncharacterized protein JCM6883_000722 [Sporobolomyces salmoneus]|uniref:uncharacterized protein n=1 Tax=Sporobolomyces salmoneus TaxID=183962 RepID=UPI00318162B9
MYFTNWDRFVSSCYALCDSSPIQPRYCLRWKPSLGLLVIKVTDDVTCIKFKTRSTVFLNRFDVFNRQLLERFQNRQQKKPLPSAVPAAGVEGEKTTEGGEGTKEGGEGETNTGTTGGGKKKKKGKKKSKA